MSGFGGFMQQLGVQAGYNLQYADQKALTDADITLKQQKIAENKMTLMQEKANMDARAKVSADFAKDAGADKASIQGPESLAKGSLAKAQEFGRLGDTEDEAKEYKKYEMFTKQASEARTDVQEKAQVAYETSAKAAENEAAMPSLEAAAETDRAAAAAGINMKDAPVFGDPRRAEWLKQRVRGAMSAKDTLAFDQKEKDLKEGREIRAQEKKVSEDRLLRTEQDRKKDREDSLQERIRHDKELELLRRSIEDRKASAPTKISARQKEVSEKEVIAANEAATSVQNIAQLTNSGRVETTSGTFDNIDNKGLFGASAGSLGRTLTSTQSQMYSSIMMPLMRTAATIQGGAYYKLNESQIQQEMRALMSQPGASSLTMLEKMAELRQTINTGLEAKLTSGTLNEAQEGIITRTMSTVEKSIPWDVSDTIEFKDTAKKGQSFGNWLKVNRGIDIKDYKKDAQARVDAKEKAASKPAPKTADDFYAHFGVKK
jgi:hypothetical protein